jgi:hypothetical protein
MDAGSPTTAEPGDHEATTRALVAQLAVRYAPVLGEALVEGTVRTALAKIRAQARIQQFVVLLAHRRAEDGFREVPQEHGAHWP